MFRLYTYILCVYCAHSIRAPCIHALPPSRLHHICITHALYIYYAHIMRALCAHYACYIITMHAPYMRATYVLCVYYLGIRCVPCVHYTYINIYLLYVCCACIVHICAYICIYTYLYTHIYLCVYIGMGVHVKINMRAYPCTL